ncbi:hypothetical protein HID58_069224 [Brassica napus]|uniref:Uncharacterized protein n=1 Tax=Brassica napus TaxID=3708 RepID=A0ABQ7XGV1_BRANA|nr:hypothetical protein HID58_069224 [Brassica napus]
MVLLLLGMLQLPTRACQPPYPDIEGRRANINLAYVNAKNNPNHSNQIGYCNRLTIASISTRWHGINTRTVGLIRWLGNNIRNFVQIHRIHIVEHIFKFHTHPCSSNMNWHQTHSVRPPGMSQPPTEPRFEELPADTNQEAVSTADGRSIQKQTVVLISKNGKAQEGEISGQNNGIKQDVKDQEGEINGQDNGIKQGVKDQEGKIVSGEDENTKQGAGVTNQFCYGIITLQIKTGREEKSENSPQENGFDHEEKTQHMEVGLTQEGDGQECMNYTDPNPESVSTADVVRNNNSEEVDTKTCNDIDQQKGKDQEGEISGEDNDTKQDVKSES